MTEYREKFEHLSATLRDASKECLMGAFKIGLKHAIRAELRMLSVGSLKELIGLAHKIEEWNEVLEKTCKEVFNKHFKVVTTTKWIGLKGDWSRVISNQDPTRSKGIDAKGGLTTIRLNCTPYTKEGVNSKASSVGSSSSSNKGGSFKRLTEAEAAKRRALGLCFKCDEKYNPTRQCKNKQLQVMILQPVNEAGPNKQ